MLLRRFSRVLADVSVRQYYNHFANTRCQLTIVKPLLSFLFFLVAATHSPAQTVTTLATFDGTNGLHPEYSRVIEASDGNFYGTTAGGGLYSQGTFFQLTPAGTLTTLYSFCAQTNCTDGAAPLYGVIHGSDGNFYGTTNLGGASNQGTVFRITTTGALTALYNFCSQANCTDGAAPYGALIQATDGNFYGTTAHGGLNANGTSNTGGTVFKITSGGVLTTLHNFCTQTSCTDGSVPQAGLVQGKDGNFYGTTLSGGVKGSGTVFKITPAGAMTRLYSYCSKTNCTDGDAPEGPLVQASNGAFYGTTSARGANGTGTVFEITTLGVLTTLHTFPTGGGQPFGGLIQAKDGFLYGTASAGGANAAGTIFKISLTGVHTTVYDFCALGQPDCADGAVPWATLVQAKGGMLYGTTDMGGASQNGTVFSLLIPAPMGKLSAASVAFNKEGLGETSPVHTITLSNVGTSNSTLAINKITPSGLHAADFAVTANSCTAITPGNPCTLSLTFSPTLVALETATFTISTNANTLTLSVSGTGVNGAVGSFTPSAIKFGSEPAGQTTPAQIVTLINNGNASLILQRGINNSLLGGTNKADFFLPPNNCPASPVGLSPGASCSFGITFTPASIGSRSATLTVNDNAVTNPQVLTLSGTGTAGVGPGITVTLAQGSLLTFSRGSGTVKIPSAAPAGGQQIFLSTNNTGLFDTTPGNGLPSSVPIAAGSMSAPFSFKASAQSGSGVITGFANNFQNGTSSLTVNNRTLTLTPSFKLVGGGGGTISASLNLTNPAPSSLTVDLYSADPSIAAISPSKVTITSGSTSPSTPIVITGTNPGSTSLTATVEPQALDAPSGYSPASANITTTNKVINLGQNLTIAQCQTLPLSISLSPPASPISVNLSSTPAGIVTFPATPVLSSAAQVTGKAVGTATVWASDPAGQYAPGSTKVAVANLLNFAQPTLNVLRFNTANITLTLGAPGCGTGYTATLSVDDSTVATIPASVHFSTGSSTATVTVTGVNVGTTQLHATGPGANTTTAAINVGPAPAITLLPVSVGYNLEVAESGTLSEPAPAGNLNVTITSSASTKVLLSPDGVTTGATSITVTVPAGSSTIPPFYAIGLVGSGTANLTAAAAQTATSPAYAPATAVVTLGPSGFYLSSPLSSFSTALALPDTALTIAPALLDASKNIVTPMAVRAGASISVPVISSSTAVGTITTTPVVFTGGMTSATTAFHPLTPGSSNISVTEPTGFSTPTTETKVVATVSSAGFTNVNAVSIGDNLQLAYTGLGLAQPAPAGNLSVMVSSSDTSKVVISASNTQLGNDSPIALTVPAGSSQVPDFYIQVIETAQNQTPGTEPVHVQVQAPGYAASTITVNVVPSGFVLGNPVSCPVASALSTTNLSTNTPLSVQSEALDPTTLQPLFVSGCGGDPLIPGVGPITVNVSSNAASVGTVTISPVTFNGGDASQATAFHPVAPGDATISIDSPTGYATPVTYRQVGATVTSAGLYFSTIPTGVNLQSQLSISLATGAPPGNENVTITSSDPSKVLLSTDPTKAGTSSVNALIFAGYSSPSVPIYAQALIANKSVNLTATTNDFGSVTAPIQLVQSGFIVGAPCASYTTFSTTPLSGDTPLVVYPAALDSNLNAMLDGYGCSPAPQEPVGPSAVQVSVDLSTDTPSVGTITISPVVFNPGDTSQSTAFHPVSLGSTHINLATPTSFTMPSAYQQIAATVTNGGIIMSVENQSGSIGQNLQALIELSLTTVAPDGAVLNVTSGDPSKLLLSTDPTVIGTASVSATIPPGWSSISTPIYAQAQNQNTQNPAPVTLTASAPQFDSGTLQVPILPSGFIEDTGCIASGNNFSTTLLSGDTTVSVFAVPLNATTLNYDSYYYCSPTPEQLNPGVGPITINVTSSIPGTGTITSSPLTFNTGDSQQSTTFHPTGLGTTQVAIGAPSVPGFVTPSNLQSATATVTNSAFYLSAGPVGNDLQAPISFSMSQPAPAGGEQVTLTSDNAGALALTTDPTQPGSASVQFTVPAGQYSVPISLYAQALAGPGSPNSTTAVNLTAAGSNFDPQTISVSLVPSGFILAEGCSLLNGNSFSTDLLSGDPTLTVYAVPLDPVTLNYSYFSSCSGFTQQLNPGVGPVTVTVGSSTASVGTITASPVTFNTSDSQQNTTFHPVSNGVTILSLGTPSVSGFSTPSNDQQLTANVVPAALYVSDVFVGKSMEVPSAISLGTPAPGGGLAVMVHSASANVVLSTDPSVPGTTTLTFNLKAGDSSTPTFYVQAKSAATGTISLTASASGYTQSSPASIHVMNSGFVIYGVGNSFATTTGSADTSLQVYPASLDSSSNLYDIETLIPGTHVQVSVLTSQTCGGSLDQTVGSITVSPVVFNGADVPDYQSTSFHPISTGSDVIYIPAPTGFSQASNNNCVTANVN